MWKLIDTNVALMRHARFILLRLLLKVGRRNMLIPKPVLDYRNNKESINSLILTFASKQIHSGKKTVEIATFLVLSISNEGFQNFQSILQILNIMGKFRVLL